MQNALSLLIKPENIKTPTAPTSRCEGVRGSSRSSAEIQVSSLELSTISISVKAVSSSLCENLACPMVFLRQCFIDHMSLSNMPPHYEALGMNKAQVDSSSNTTCIQHPPYLRLSSTRVFDIQGPGKVYTCVGKWRSCTLNTGSVSGGGTRQGFPSYLWQNSCREFVSPHSFP